MLRCHGLPLTHQRNIRIVWELNHSCMQPAGWELRRLKTWRDRAAAPQPRNRTNPDKQLHYPNGRLAVLCCWHLGTYCRRHVVFLAPRVHAWSSSRVGTALLYYFFLGTLTQHNLGAIIIPSRCWLYNATFILGFASPSNDRASALVAFV